MKHIELYVEVDADFRGLEALLDKTAAACFEVEGIQKAAFCIRIVDATEIRRLNREMRQIDKVTDVLSFPTMHYPKGKTAGNVQERLRLCYDPSMHACNLGDCVINLERALQQASEYGHSAQRELAYLTAHSAFHLMGYDHMTEEEKPLMRAKEEQAMGLLGLTRKENL